MRKFLPVFLFLLIVFTAVVPSLQPVFAQRDDGRRQSDLPVPIGQDEFPGQQTNTPNNVPGSPNNGQDCSDPNAGGRCTPNVRTPAPGAADGAIPDDSWVQDKEVTFTGKNAARAGLLLNWALTDYNWSYVRDQNQNPLADFWAQIRNIVFGLLILFVLVTAFVLITTRGRSLTAMRFIPRFIAVIILIFFSYTIISTIYSTTDLIQGYFLRSKTPGFCPPDCISQEDLLFVGWEYGPFFGIRRFGEQYEESAFISLLLVKLTALTYYVMVGVLLIRKIILWFFLIISPIFPLLLLYYPVRNTGKIWIGEFFRWLLYAPLFAIFLGGLVALWRTNIPMNFDFRNVGKVNEIVFPTAINILIGGPKQVVNLTNSVNIADTFALYVVALLMLWGVIIVPWILLQIFLDFAFAYNYGENPWIKQMVSMIGNKPPPGPTKPPSAPTGSARALPFKDFIVPQMQKGAGLARQIPRQQQQVQPVRVPLSVNQKQLSEVQKLTNLSVPTMRDISRYETALLSKDTSRQTETTRIKQQLSQIAMPTSATSVQMRERLMEASKQGNVIASNILNAANSSISSARNVTTTIQQVTTQQVVNMLQQLSRPETVSNPVERQKIIQMKDTIIKESKTGNPLAVTIINATKSEKPTEAEAQRVSEKLKEAKAKGDPLAKSITTTAAPAAPTGLPATNRVQQVSLDDYEAVKKMWTENYHNLETPAGVTDRTAWVKEDVTQVAEAINLLTSTDPRQVEEGMQQVSNILPFLMIGGFSQSEMIAYLKAKQEAGKSVLEEIEKTRQDEETMVEAGERKTQKAAHMAASQEAPLEENPVVSEADTAPKQPENGNQPQQQNGQNGNGQPQETDKEKV